MRIERSADVLRDMLLSSHPDAQPSQLDRAVQVLADWGANGAEGEIASELQKIFEEGELVTPPAPHGQSAARRGGERPGDRVVLADASGEPVPEVDGPDRDSISRKSTKPASRQEAARKRPGGSYRAYCRRKTPPLNRKQVTAAQRMREDGLSVEEIAKKLDVDAGSVSKALKMRVA